MIADCNLQKKNKLQQIAKKKQMELTNVKTDCRLQSAITDSTDGVNFRFAICKCRCFVISKTKFWVICCNLQNNVIKNADLQFLIPSIVRVDYMSVITYM